MRQLLASPELSAHAYNLFVSNYTGSLFDAGSQTAKVELTDEHDRQHFVWMPGEVRFLTISAAGEVSAQVYLANEIAVGDDARMAVLVPFPVFPSGGDAVFVGGQFAGNEAIVPLAPGHYALLYEIGYKTHSNDPGWELGPELPDWHPSWPMWCRFTFVPQQTVRAEVLRPGFYTPPEPLVMGAQPGQYTLTGEPIQQ